MPDDPSWVRGYLTHSGGRGGISWDRFAGGDALVGPAPDPAADAQYQAMWTAHVQARSYARYPRTLPTLEFGSDPLPREIRLNPARLIHLDLMVSGGTSAYGIYDPCYHTIKQIGITSIGGPDPHLRIELWMGDTRVAAVHGQNYISWFETPTKARPSDPPGFAACHFAMQAEVPSIPKDAKLTLKVIHLTQSRNIQYGLGSDGGSLLYLPTFSAEEWSFRDPALETTRQGGVTVETGDADAAFAGLLGLGVLGMAGARRRGALLAVMLVLTAVSGCLTTKQGPKASQDQDATKQGSVLGSFVEGGLVGANGSIVGLIADDLGIPIKSVHISVLGTDRFTQSDERGRFRLENLPAGKYALRFDAKEYKSLEAETLVKSGVITKLEVILVLASDKDADLRPHRHDYWQGNERLVVLDSTIGQSCTATGCVPASSFRIPNPEGLTEFRSVVPGTYVVEVVVRWDSTQIPMKRVGLRFQSQLDVKGQYAWNWTAMASRPPGEPFLIQTAWEMSDPGHQAWSGWNFGIDRNPWDAEGDASVSSGSGQFHVKITLHKGRVPFEPPHPDTWSQSGFRVLGKLPMTLYRDSLNLALAPYNFAATCGLSSCDNYGRLYFGAPKAPVPHDASRLRVYLNQSVANNPAHDWILTYRPANAPYAQHQYLMHEEANPTAKPTTMRTEWVVNLRPESTDPIYATKSGWYFTVRPSDPNTAFLNRMDPVSGNVALTLDIVAFK